MAISFSQRDLIGTVGRTTRIKVLATFAASDTTGSHTFSRAFRATPEVVGVARVDNVSSVILPRISAISATGLTVLAASATGSEVAEIVVEGELA